MNFKTAISTKVIPAITRFTNAKYVKILMDGFMGVTALTIGASFFTILRSLPLGSWYTQFLNSTGLYDILNLPIIITNNLISLYMVLALGYFTAKAFGKNPLSGSLISLGAFLILCPFQATTTYRDAAGNTIEKVISDVLPMSSFGATGMFLAMIVGILAARLYVFLLSKNIKIKMPDSVPPNVANMFETMIPAALVIIVFMAVRVVVGYTPYKTTQQLIYSLLQAPLTMVGGGFGGFLFYIFIMSFLWLFGVHGGMVAYVGMSVIFKACQAANMSAYAAGTMAPYPEWTFMPFALIGGAGATFALALLMLLFGKSQISKKLSKIAIIPAIFNINEPLIYGTPIIMNPFLAVPFIVAPLLNTVLTYVVMKLGIVVMATGAAVNTQMPILLVGSLVNAHWSGAVWMAVLIVIDMFVWLPFFKAWDNSKVAEEKKMEEAMKTANAG